MFRVNNFDKLLDKATSNLRLDPDWPTILQICDLIRQNDCTPKYAVAGLKKKLYSQNPHQAMFALLTLESIVKNCGSGIHDEVASKAFCEMLRDLVKSTPHENLKTKVLELIQAWAFAFRNTPKYRSVQDTVNILKAEGYKFPALKESDAMFSADTAPEWADGEVCHRCRTAFTLMVRRHHCRACGQVFCQQCSSKTSTLPKFGIEKEVRVCDACYDKVSRPPSSSAKLDIVDTANDYGTTTQTPELPRETTKRKICKKIHKKPESRPAVQKKAGKTAEELQEEEELQLALALSQSEAEQKEKERRTRSSHITPNPAPQQATGVSPTPSSVSASPEHNSELSRYLDRGYWEQRRDAAAPTAPQRHRQPDAAEEYAQPTSSKAPEEESEDKEIDEFVSSLKSQLEIFVNRMKSNSSRGRSIANDTSVQSLFMNLTAMHSRLLRYIQLQDDKRVYLESLQDKVTQVRDSRAALDTLRAEHAARVAAAAEAHERQRQMQMAAKLQAMRKKKHEYLQYQRQLALQRVQEQEREMQMRQEQQKQQYMMSANSGYFMPGVSLQQYQSYPNQPIYASPQFHPQMIPQTSAEPSIINQMNAQSMPQLTQSYPISAPSGVAITQAQINAQASMTQPNVRQNLPQQMSVQQQLMMQQMQQMRLASQPGVHMLANLANGLPVQNGQITKQNQASVPNTMAPQMSNAQPIGQSQVNVSNPMMGMQMRMPMMQNPSQQIPGYQMNQPGQIPNLQQPSQIHVQGQPMSLPGQMMPGQALPGQGMMIGHGPTTTQSHGQMSQTHQQIPNQMQPPGQQMNMQGQMISQGQAPQLVSNQHVPQQQQLPQQHQQMSQQQQHQISNQQQHIPNQQQQQQMPNQQQMPQQQIPQQQIPQQQNQQMTPQQQQIIQQQQIPQQNQGPPPGPQNQQFNPQMPGQIPQQPNQGQVMQMMSQVQIPQGQQMKAGPPPNFTNVPSQGTAQTSQQSQQTNAKTENNNNTAELISFD